MDDPIREAKAALRARMRERAASLTAEERRSAGEAIAARVLALPEYGRAGTVMAFVSLPGEPDTRPILEDVLAKGKTLLLPRCGEAPRMRALPVRDLTALKPGRMGIPEPEEPAPEETVPEPDLILIPCMAASRDGRRLGHGKGYYDWFLSRHGGTRVILCLSAFVTEEVPCGPEDVRGDLVLTEQERKADRG